ncbi:hypothetical protein M0G74_05240 [Microbulbifer sp. CAU 1566]|uniref:hypothetical protein n=1 Tax=Microbulbifer sp. CAU 1566 TaxID=2933269 RepID=UPI002005E9FE|nr:hypothetical protein [Microbulbifer sp. CAU 1566]MCK7596676.1 hypothetical protein [Microbulbifer sp. CAU 1566]
MKVRNMTLLAAVFLGAITGAAHAQDVGETERPDSTIINIAGHEVPLVKGGLYDRYRSNPPLSVVAAESPETDLSWFKTLEKTKVDIGFESYSPNFYYENSRITAVFTADLSGLRELMPSEVLEQVQPIQIWPNRGLVALTAYAYHYCDNDSYNEIALSIITNKPGGSNLGPFTMLGQTRSKSFWGYVLKLPVDTELARVRGVVGYNLPKWLTDINYREGDESLTFEVIDRETGEVDVVFEGAKLKDLSSDVAMVTNSFTNIDEKGSLIYGYSVSRQLSYASSTSDEAVNLTLTDGSLSRYIKTLDLGSVVKYEYVPDFQSALYVPKPLSAMLQE